MKKFLFIIDPLPGLCVKTDTTLALMQEAQSRGIETHVCELKDIALNDGKVCFRSHKVSLAAGYSEVPKYIDSPRWRLVDEFQVVFMRKDPPVDAAFLASLFMLYCHDPVKTKIINDPFGLLLANEKLFGLKVLQNYYPKTIVASEKNILIGFAKEQGKVAIKPLFSSGGAGVLILQGDDKNLTSALELLSNSFSQPIMMQSYIDNARKGDKRILLLGGKPLGAILRVPCEEDHRANIHAGGSVRVCDISPREQEICRDLGPILLKYGLHFVGIDVIGGFITEINVTSPTCLIEIEKYSQGQQERPLRKQVLDYIETLLVKC